MNKSLRPWRDQYCRCEISDMSREGWKEKGWTVNQRESEFRFSVVWYLMYRMELELLSDGPSSMRGEVTTYIQKSSEKSRIKMDGSSRA